MTEAPIQGESATVPDLAEGEDYEYRVAAVTDAGLGDYSNATPPVKAERKKRNVARHLLTVFRRLCCVVAVIFSALLFRVDVRIDRIDRHAFSSFFCPFAPPLLIFLLRQLPPSKHELLEVVFLGWKLKLGVGELPPPRGRGVEK